MVIEIYLFTHNEIKLLPYVIQHYSFADKIVLMDGQSDDGSLEYVKKFKKVKVIQIDSGGEIRDDIHREWRNKVWKGSKADWVIVGDCDEFVYCTVPEDDGSSEVVEDINGMPVLAHPPFPFGDFNHRRIREYKDIKLELSKAKYNNIAVMTLAGYEMITKENPFLDDKPFVEKVKYGNLNLQHLSKPILFRPDKVIEMNIKEGGHRCNPIMEEGYRFIFTGDIKLLHYNKMTLEFHLERTNQRRKRKSKSDLENGWGYHHFWSDEYIADLFEQEYQTRSKVI